jgi:uncharacterized membrane protein YhaH (DUF805 family)
MMREAKMENSPTGVTAGSPAPAGTGTTPGGAAGRSPQRRFWWLRLLAGPIIYAVYFMLAYLAVEAACNTGALRFSVAGTNGITAVVIGLTVLAFAAVLVSLLLGVRRWRSGQRNAQRDGQHRNSEYGDTDGFVTQVGIMLDVLFLFLILATGAPPLLLAPCAWS